MPVFPTHASDVDTAICRAAWVFFLVCVVIAVAGLVWCARTALFVRRAAVATGVVVTVEETIRSRDGRPDPAEGKSYNPVVAYTDVSGTRHEVRSSRAARRQTFENGDQVQVFYDPAAPEQMFINHAYILWFAPGIVAGLGIFCAFFAGLGLSQFSRG